MTILPKETATTLYKKVNTAHETLIGKLFWDLYKNDVTGVVQDESKATYWGGRKPEDGEIVATMTMEEVDRLVRATTKPYPGAYIIKGKKKATVTVRGVAVRVILPLIIIDCIHE